LIENSIYFFLQIGSCGFLPASVWGERNIKIVRYDIENKTPFRNQLGFCEPCAQNEAGEMIFKLTEGKYDCYVGIDDKFVKNIYHNVFSVGDAWWSTGDLLRFDKEGFFYFVDRVENTFMWKGEAISTIEISRKIELFDPVQRAYVYGISVPNQEGQAVMCCVWVNGITENKQSPIEDLDSKAEIDQNALNSFLTKFYDYLKAKLPANSIPLFLRLVTSNRNFPVVLQEKCRYANEGFNPTFAGDDLLFFCDKTIGVETYLPIDNNLYLSICSGNHFL